MIALSCTEIEKSYGVVPILKKITFSIQTGDRIGLIGNNGAGKSTLFQILCSKQEPSGGSLFVGKGLSIGYLEQSSVCEDSRSLFDFCLDVFSELVEHEQSLRHMEEEMAKGSVCENAPPQELLDAYAHSLESFSEKNGYGYKSEIRGVLNGLGFAESDFSRPVHLFSGGQKSRIGIARLLLTKPDILLLDEPTNHLDIDSVNWLESFLSAYDGTLLVISHDRYFLDQVVTSIFELEHGKLLSHKGSYSEFLNFKNEFHSSQKKAAEKQEKEIRRQEEIIRKYKERGTEKLAKRAASREKRLSRLTPLEKPLAPPPQLSLQLMVQKQTGHDVLHVENLSMSYEASAPLFSNLNFEIYAGERIGLIGPNGVGKTTLFKIILSRLFPTEGTVDFGHHVHLGYYDQEQADFGDERDLIETISDEFPNLTVPEIRNLLGQFLFRGDDVFKKTQQLSGGEKGRIALLRLMLTGANVLLLDEPTNHLDIGSKEILEKALLDYGGTLLAISHDRYFLNKVCTKVFDLQSNGITVYLGNYDDYKEKKLQRKALLEDEDSKKMLTKTQAKAIRQKERERSAQAKALKKKQEDLENHIHKLEEDIATVDKELCNPDVYKSSETSRTLHQKRKILEEALTKLYNEWEAFL